jgi:hypothetical protein
MMKRKLLWSALASLPVLAVAVWVGKAATEPCCDDGCCPECCPLNQAKTTARTGAKATAKKYVCPPCPFCPGW